MAVFVAMRLFKSVLERQYPWRPFKQPPSNGWPPHFTALWICSTTRSHAHVDTFTHTHTRGMAEALL